MSEVRSDVDLARLARARRGEGAKAPVLERPKRSWSRWAIPSAIVLGFAGLLLWSLGDALRPRIPVRIERPLIASGASHAAEAPAAMSAAPAFAAAGWVEADPFPISVTPLVDGYLESVLVQEGDVLRAGQAVARLVADDAELERDRARAELALAEAQVAEARVRADFAKQSFDARIELDEQLAKSEAELRGATKERDALRELAARREAEVEVAREELVVQRDLRSKGVGGKRQVELAEARVDAARASLEEARARAIHARAQLDVARAARTRAQRDGELRIEERRRVEASKVALGSAEAKRASAAVRLRIAELAVSRLIVRAPAAGTVLERTLAPGQRVAGRSVVTLYDPASLRVRVDVPQESIARARVGQGAQILSEARPGRPYRGEVQRTIHKADIQKVTLEVRVRVLDPDKFLRPEMLCQVRFAGGASVGAMHGHGGRGAGKKPGKAGGGEQVASARLLLVAKDLVADGEIWVLDPDGPRMRKRSIRVGRQRQEAGRAWVEVLDGLDPSDKLVRAPAAARREGALVRIEGDAR